MSAEEQMGAESIETMPPEILEAAQALHDLGLNRDSALARQLAKILTVVAAEAQRSARFSKALSTALKPEPQDEAESHITSPPRSRRRVPATLDPFTVFATDGEEGLRQQLAKLDLEQLRDILAEHRLDHDRLAMKWKDPDRVIDRIFEMVVRRSTKGSAFR